MEQEILVQGWAFRPSTGAFRMVWNVMAQHYIFLFNLCAVGLRLDRSNCIADRMELMRMRDVGHGVLIALKVW